MDEDQFYHRIPGTDWLVWNGPGEPTKGPSESLIQQAAKEGKAEWDPNNEWPTVGEPEAS
jgi:hypothetical protein